MDKLIGERELEVLHELWRAGPSTVAEVRQRLGDDLAYTTVLTTLRNLELKELVTHEVEGRVHRFAAAVAAKTVHESAVTRLLRTVFQGDAIRLVTSLVDRQALAASELRALAEMVEARETAARSADGNVAKKKKSSDRPLTRRGRSKSRADT